MIKKFAKRLVGKEILQRYHRTLSWCAAWWYGHPSEKMIVVGVTGTKGKSTTSAMICRVLEEAGYTVGLTTTVLFRIAGREWLNDTKMTMLGRFRLQKLLSQMVAAGCQYAVVETSSEGIAQYRHAGINYDVVVHTNLTPEHIASHGSYEKYRAAKGMLFAKLSTDSKKVIRGKVIPKVSIVNLGDAEAEYFLKFAADTKVGYRVAIPSAAPKSTVALTVEATDITPSSGGMDFVVSQTPFHLPLPGIVNVANALAAISVGLSQGVSFDVLAGGLAKMPTVPGRFERIDEGQPYTVIVDYAHEPASFAQLYDTVLQMSHRHIIHVFGSCGGGRDANRRSVLGKLAGERADTLIITNEDPYDDDPMEIITAVADGARSAGKRDGENLEVIKDRREAIRHAIARATPGDVVLITGKGAEQAIVVAGGKKLPWDDRIEARRAITDTGTL